MLDVKHRAECTTRETDRTHELFGCRTLIEKVIEMLRYRHDVYCHPDDSLRDDLEMFGEAIWEAWLTPRELMDNNIMTYRNENHDLDEYMDDNVMCVEFVRHFAWCKRITFRPDIPKEERRFVDKSEREDGAVIKLGSWSGSEDHIFY